MSINKKNVVAYAEMLALLWVLHHGGIVKYIIFIIWVYMVYYYHKKRMLPRFWYVSVPALFCVSYGLLCSIVNRTFSFETIKEIGFILIPVGGVCMIFNCENRRRIQRYIDAIFFAIITLFLMDGIPRFNLRDLMESTYAFAFGAYVIYYLYYKKYTLLSIATICVILAGKRIVWGAVIAGVAVITVLQKKDRKKKHYYKRASRYIIALSLICVVALLFFVYTIKSGIMGTFMLTHGINPMGRLGVWEFFSKYYSFSALFPGLGLGSVQMILNDLGNEYFARLHNDILMYYIQLGFWGFAVYVVLHFEVVRKLIHKRYIGYRQMVIVYSLLIYTFVCFCTDNISIYINYLFPFYLILQYCIFYPPEQEVLRKYEVLNYHDII